MRMIQILSAAQARELAHTGVTYRVMADNADQ